MPDRVRSADRIVLPGVGAYADCAAGLHAVDGMWEAVEEAAIARGRPFLGICVGMQLMSERGLEKTVTNGFGWIAGDVKEIAPTDPALKIPQIGWNTIHVKQPHPLFAGIATGETGCTPISSIPIISTRPIRRRSWRRPTMAARSRRRSPRQSRRHAVPSGKEPGARPGADRQFPEVEAV